VISRDQGMIAADHHWQCWSSAKHSHMYIHRMYEKRYQIVSQKALRNPKLLQVLQSRK